MSATMLGRMVLTLLCLVIGPAMAAGTGPPTTPQLGSDSDAENMSYRFVLLWYNVWTVQY